MDILKRALMEWYFHFSSMSTFDQMGYVLGYSFLLALSVTLSARLIKALGWLD